MRTVPWWVQVAFLCTLLGGKSRGHCRHRWGLWTPSKQVWSHLHEHPVDSQGRHGIQGDIVWFRELSMGLCGHPVSSV